MRVFEASGLAAGVAIDIRGTPEEPLFQANQIGAQLGLGNIRETIEDFDEDELRVRITDTSRAANFLTELGLYRLLGMSRKPLARPFQKWVAKAASHLNSAKNPIGLTISTDTRRLAHRHRALWT